MYGLSLWALSLLGLAVDARQLGPRHLPPNAKNLENHNHAAKRHLLPSKRDVYPANVTEYSQLLSPTGVRIRYKEPGKEGVCETTPGVNSYSGYVDLAPDMHAFFWFFESRRDPANDPVTLWLNGGPGSDSQIGLFQELGPCNITEDLKSAVNPYAWNNFSNVIFLSQPYGVGFSYQTEEIGSFNNVSGSFVNATVQPATGRWPVIDVTAIDTTELAAIAAYEIIQAFYSGLSRLAPSVKSTQFNLATESYGGHYGPAFYDHFYKQNERVRNNEIPGYLLDMNALLIINGIINEEIQVPYYPKFATNNTYGIKAYNQTVYDHAQFTLNMPNGCLDQIKICNTADRASLAGQSLCAEAAAMCRDSVEGLYYSFGNNGVYDIRHPYDDPTPPDYFADYLNLPEIQQAIGVDLNYTTSNGDIYFAFQQTGDFVYPDFLDDLSEILNNGVRVSLIYGDADYICNWFGGEAVSVNVNYTHAEQFRAAGYVPFKVDGVEYGEVRQYGNFSFTRVYEAGHEVPYYQPIAAQALFNRTINLLDIATGETKITDDLSTNGTATATHTEIYTPLPSTALVQSSSSSAPAATSSGSPGVNATETGIAKRPW